ncbi:MAG: radical SAM protein [Nitrososphaerales archaeon]
MTFDPLKLTESIAKIVVKGNLRRYYRLARGGKWYGGIATADCSGCNLRCVFCWSGEPRDNPTIGQFYSPEEVFQALTTIANKKGYKLLRVSGNEPTISRDHLLKLLELVEISPFYFILETNGILIGADKNYAKEISKFKHVHVRVSLKGATPEEFSMLTEADSKAYELQLNALKNLIDYGVECHLAVMLSFSSDESKKKLIEKLLSIDKMLVREIEEEYVFLYPHVKKRLERARINPILSYNPKTIPKELI